MTTGNVPEDVFNSASAEIKNMVITWKQQYDLFVSVCEEKKKEVIRISAVAFNVANYGVLNWEGVDGEIQDMIVDLIYRGDYTPASRVEVQRPFVENNLMALKAVMSNQADWPNVPPDRFITRSNYL